jgi:diacylglycerol kinase
MSPDSFLAVRLRSFRHAFAGLAWLWRTQPNTRIHALATAAVGGLMLWLPLSRLEIALLLWVIAAVWSAELLNTAIEALADRISPDRHPLIKVAKDSAAAAVLVLAIAAVLIGLLILAPPLWHAITTRPQ